MQRIRVDCFGSNEPLWSVACELWYYILFPLAYCTWRKWYGVLGRMMCAAVFLALCFSLGQAVMVGFPYWLAGAVLARLPRPRLTQSVRLLVGLLYAPLFFASVLISKHPRFEAGGTWTLVLATSGLLWCMLSAGEPADGRSWGVRLSRQSARFSYTLYAVHFPLLVLLTSLTVHDGPRWQPAGVHLAIGLGLLLVTVLYAWCVASIFEFRTDRIRSSVERLLGASEPATAKIL